MKQFVIFLQNKRKGELNQELLRAHIAHLRELKAQNVLVLCGPFADNDGAMKVIRAEDMDQAVSFAKQDPFTIHSYYRNFEVCEFLEANEENNYLLQDPQTISNQNHSN